MHCPRTFLECLLCLLLFAQAGYPVHAAEHEHDGRNQGRLRGPLQYLNIVRGLFSSKDIVKYISQIPCDIVQTLENDANEAKKFIDQLEEGKVPSLIENLPEEVLGSVKDVFGIFLTLPSDMVSVAEDAFESAVNLFNDIESGAIFSDLEDLDDKIVSGVTDLWGSFTSGLQSGWDAATGVVKCFPTACPVSSDALGSCQGNTAATTTGNGGGPSETGQPSFQPSISSTFSSATPVQTPVSVPSPTGNTFVVVPSFTNNTLVGVPSPTNNIPAGAPSTNTAPASVPSPNDNTLVGVPTPTNNIPASVPSPTVNTPVGQTSALVNPSAGVSASPPSNQAGGSAKNLPSVFLLEGITKVCVLASLGLLELFVWL